MSLWRISNYTDLAGQGGLLCSGRWHHRGAPIVYLAEHPALALLETLVHLNIDKDDLPEHYQLLEVDQGEASVARLAADALEDNWTSSESTSRAIGSQWLASSSSALLKVPSAISPMSYNFLFNPQHSDAGLVSIRNVMKWPYDDRLLR